MSNNTNDTLLQEAKMYQEEFIGTYMGDALELALLEGDLDTLHHLMPQCRQADFDLNYRPNELEAGDVY